MSEMYNVGDTMLKKYSSFLTQSSVANKNFIKSSGIVYLYSHIRQGA